MKKIFLMAAAVFVFSSVYINAQIQQDTSYEQEYDSEFEEEENEEEEKIVFPQIKKYLETGMDISYYMGISPRVNFLFDNWEAGAAISLNDIWKGNFQKIIPEVEGAWCKKFDFGRLDVGGTDMQLLDFGQELFVNSLGAFVRLTFEPDEHWSFSIKYALPVLQIVSKPAETRADFIFGSGDNLIYGIATSFIAVRLGFTYQFTRLD